jgi:deoxyribodipyrimidine photo-lyase
MRAMLVSFLTHLLWQPWQSGVYHLAQLFLDYEPGIHFSQFQMQASVTGINTIRIYNPIKQSQEKDAEGVFIRKWVPELALLPTKQLHQPETMTTIEQKLYHCEIGTDYPSPIIDFKKNYKEASARLHELKKSSQVRAENYRILSKHVRQKA